MRRRIVIRRRRRMMTRLMSRRKMRKTWPHSALLRGRAVQREGEDWSSPLVAPSSTNIFAFLWLLLFWCLVFQTKSCSPFVGVPQVSFWCVLNHPCTFVHLHLSCHHRRLNRFKMIPFLLLVLFTLLTDIHILFFAFSCQGIWLWSALD